MPRESLVQRAAHDRRLPTRSERPAVGTPTATTTPAFLCEASALSSSNRGAAGWRTFSGLVAILLVLLLLAQVLLQQRDWLAARAPAAAPLLKRACAMLGCTIAAPREIDALVISNSSLIKVGADGYRLSLAVKNRSDLRLAMPGIELSLLDRAERTVLRRVLMTHDIGADETLEPFGEWAGAVQFDLPDRTVQVAGYRVLAFYP